MTSGRCQELFPHIRQSFRDSFNFPHKKMVQWFPGHMNRGLKQMEYTLKAVDCVLEVHDARIPISGRNPRLAQSFLAPKPYVLLLNKSDLIPKDHHSDIRSMLKETENIDHVIFTNAKDQACLGLKSVIKKVGQLVVESERYNRKDAKDYNAMVIGVPNVGKSSLINAIRSLHMKKRGALAVAPTAGVTKAVHERMRVSNSPAVYLFDTPGIMNPNINSMETGMRLAVCSNFKDHLVGEDVVADYLLYWLNKNEEFGYVSALGLAAPTDCINDVLIHLCVQRNLRHKKRHVDGTYKEFPDLKQAAQLFIMSFRQLQFGPILLDKDLVCKL